MSMIEDAIAELGIDGDGRLYVRPATALFPGIYRAAMEVNWDDHTRRLFSPPPRKWAYADWFKQIIEAASDEYGIALKLVHDTTFVNIPDSLLSGIQSAHPGV
jgi:Integron Cassette Protein Hfx_Cass5